MAQATGDVSVVTTSTCIPSPGWLAAIDAAHRGNNVAVGGTIDIAPDATLVDRAVHLVRYTSYLPPLDAADVEEIAGDNGTYRRVALADLLPAIARDGFWEPEIHRILRDRGGRLGLDPAIRVSFSGAGSIRAFSRQRYRHGRVFGRARAGAASPLGRVALAASAPLVPGVMLMRALRRLRRIGRLDGRACLAAPLAAWFFTCWAAGEAAGFMYNRSPRV